MGGWKQKSEWIQILPTLAFLSLFPFYLNVRRLVRAIPEA